MFVKIEIFASREEFLEYKKGYEECNDEKCTMEMFYQNCIDDFMADHSDYLDPNRCSVFIY